MSMQLIAANDGTVRYLAGEERLPLTEQFGPVQRHVRCSRVDGWDDLSWTAQGWIRCYRQEHAEQPQFFWVDLLQLANYILGPFLTYDLAIQAEVHWLKEHQLPLP